MSLSSSLPYTLKIETDEQDIKDRINLFNTPGNCLKYPMLIAEPGPVYLCQPFLDMAEEIYNLDLRPDDVWVVTYPKCGTTWSQEMVWQIIHDVDLDKGREVLDSRFPFLEVPMLVTDEAVPSYSEATMEAMRSGLDRVKAMKSPRCIKTHLPFNMLPPKLLETCKVVFVARNPKDVCVSYFNHHQMIQCMLYTGDFPTFAQLFKEGKLAWGDYWHHLEEAWKRRHNPNLVIIWYEEMKKDLTSVLARVARHLLHRELSASKTQLLAEHLKFDNFRANPAVRLEALVAGSGKSFVRKGQVGDWQNYFSPQMNAEWEAWIHQKMKQQHCFTEKAGNRLIKQNMDHDQSGDAMIILTDDPDDD